MEEGRNRGQVIRNTLKSLQTAPSLCPLKAFLVFFLFPDPNLEEGIMRRGPLKMPMCCLQGVIYISLEAFVIQLYDKGKAKRIGRWGLKAEN